MIYFFTAGSSPALTTAAAIIGRIHPVLPEPDGRITHLLLPVPSFQKDGSLVGGGNLSPVLQKLPENITVIGGNLGSHIPAAYPCIDLLQDPFYLAENAAITAQCAVIRAFSLLPATPKGCPVLILGWGRVGKALGLLLQKMGAHVTIYARKPSDRACAVSLGLMQSDWDNLYFPHYRIVFNTVPTMLLPRPPVGPLFIDLASVPGIGGDSVISARGLPGLDAPESSGKLIARSMMRILTQKETPI